MKVKTSELSEAQEKHVFEEWFELRFRQTLKNGDLPALEQRRIMTMAFYAWEARAKLGDEVEIPDEPMESQQ